MGQQEWIRSKADLANLRDISVKREWVGDAHDEDYNDEFPVCEKP